MLWFALQLPLFPMESLGYGTTSAAVGVVEQQQIVLLNRAASEAGVRPHMTPGEARAMSDAIVLLPRQRETEARNLRHLADWAYQFSGQVSPRTPDGLLLEIGASLRLFGGLSPLCRRITEELETLGHAYRYGIAPTPTAAWMLASGGGRHPVTEHADLADQLAPLPCAVLELSPAQQQALHGLGLHTLGDCLRLPRRDLARRFGRELLLQLEHALGERPEPRRAHQPPRRFHRQLDLPAEAHDTRSIAFALQRMLRELTGLLRGLDGGTQSLQLELLHARVTATQLHIGLLQPSRDPDHLLDVCQHRLDREALAAPVIGLRLRVDRIQPLAPETQALLPDPARDHAQQHQHLWERLGARLGDEAVQGLGLVADHRPERAWQTQPSDTTGEHPAGERPLWLLPQPTPLRQQQGQPCWHGPLTLEHGPERIETGWWDGGDVCRDYYHARASQGSRLWVYQDRRSGNHWFLHGFFG
ncbi:Y-family DNA polymerase [Aquisalimonas asiatica]|uniref:Protein ImuB n=1 Tax=Aquisalimonas asiatica TaxID=406100 RepID=A0A1H8RYL0_9GAMM|nr:DNA polymerase Y family protein [Aquisalimonas asiatica]SEO71465.1 protein ImuB [Aquisalimonas asiatica]